MDCLYSVNSETSYVCCYTVCPFNIVFKLEQFFASMTEPNK